MKGPATAGCIQAAFKLVGRCDAPFGVVATDICSPQRCVCSITAAEYTAWRHETYVCVVMLSRIFARLAFIALALAGIRVDRTLNPLDPIFRISG